MNRYQQLFAELRDRREGALIPFLMLGDPSPEQSFARMCAVVEAGADALELGIPYSDPVADGPTIVAAANRALAAGVTPASALELVARLRSRYPQLPIGLLVYANLVYAYQVCAKQDYANQVHANQDHANQDDADQQAGTGIERFFAAAKTAGVDSILVPDVPVRESAAIRAAGARCGIDTVFILPPNADTDTQANVAQLSQGYVYLLSRAGVTGTETAANMPLRHLLSALAAQRAAPAILGFGISTPAHVRGALAAGAAGVIVGSALVSQLATVDEAAHEAALAEVRHYIGQMKAATMAM